MTSSLVGSEMCIRDRPHWAAPPARSPGPPAAGCVPPGAHLPPPPPACAPGPPLCLLYTSDAADDM
eukprot:4462136-Prorocentrum_lima.AAC.1